MLLRLSPVWLVLLGICSLQFGAGVAKSLFGEIGPTAMVWLRLASSALILLAIARPHLRARTRADWLVVLGFGTTLGLMNWSIYQSFSRIPLGIAVTIEFLGPLTIAILGSHRARDLVWVALAALGVVLLGVERAALDPVGVGFALLAACTWAGYILLSAETGRRWPGIGGLTMASIIAACGLAPLAVGGYGGQMLDPRILMLGGLVALLSSVIPYACEMTALRSIAPGVFGILMSLEPAAAALAGLLVVGEILSPLQVLAVLCVIIASVGATRTGPAMREPAPD